MKTTKDYRVKKVLNNSSIIVTDRFFEIVFIGKGIAFGKKTGDILPKGFEYEQKYQSSNRFNQFSLLLDGYSDRIIQMVMDTIQMISTSSSGNLNSTDFRSIADHLAAAYTRISEGKAIYSFFSFEIRALYPKAYEQSERIAEKINLKYGFIIPEAEIGYIALHIQSVCYPESKSLVDKMSVIMSEVYDLFVVKYNINLDASEVNYLRFLTHLRFLVEGALNFKRDLGLEVDDLLLKKYPLEAQIANEIVNIVLEQVQVKISQQELIYILIHVINVNNQYKNDE